MSAGPLILSSRHLYKNALVGNSTSCAGLSGSVTFTFPIAYAPYQKTTVWRKSNYSPGIAAIPNYPHEQHEPHFSSPYLAFAKIIEHHGHEHHAQFLTLETPRVKFGILPQFNHKQALYNQITVNLFRRPIKTCLL